MTWWRKHVLGLGLSGELLGEDLAFNVSVWSDVRDGQGDALAHDLCVEVVAFDLFLHFSGEELDRVRVRPMRRLVGFAFHVSLVVDQVMVINDHCGQVFGQLVLEIGVVGIASCLLRKRVACDVDHIDGPRQRQIPQTPLAVDHVKRDVQLLQLLEVVPLIKHLRVELEELVSGDIQTLKALDRSESLENNGWTADRGNRGEEIACEVQILQILQLEHIVR